MQLSDQEKIEYQKMMQGAGFAAIAAFLLLKIEHKEDPKLVRTAILIAGIGLIFFSEIIFKTKK